MNTYEYDQKILLNTNSNISVTTCCFTECLSAGNGQQRGGCAGRTGRANQICGGHE